MASVDDADVRSRIDLRSPTDAADWAATADVKRPWRAELRAIIAGLVRGSRRILELGPGPGLLAESVLAVHAVERYALFDFSPPMLAMCRARLGDRPDVSYVLGDFTQLGWTRALALPFDAVVAMQAVHEVRHKRHVPRLYADIRTLLVPGGLLVICDHDPMPSLRHAAALHSTAAEQHDAMSAAGFAEMSTHVASHDQYVCSARRR